MESISVEIILLLSIIIQEIRRYSSWTLQGLNINLGGFASYTISEQLKLIVPAY